MYISRISVRHVFRSSEAGDAQLEHQRAPRVTRRRTSLPGCTFRRFHHRGKNVKGEIPKTVFREVLSLGSSLQLPSQCLLFISYVQSTQSEFYTSCPFPSCEHFPLIPPPALQLYRVLPPLSLTFTAELRGVALTHTHSWGKEPGVAGTCTRHGWALRELRSLFNPQPWG